MTILLVAQVFPPKTGGSGRWMWELYRRLSHADVVVAAGAGAGDEAFDATSGLRVHRLPLDFPSWGLLSPASSLAYFAALRRLRTVMRANAVSQIHCAKALPEGLLGFALGRLQGVPFTCYAHGEELRLAHTSRELRALTGRVLRAASRVIANSQFTRAELIERWGIAADRITVMPPGVDTTRFTPAAPDADARRRLGWSGRRVVLTVGTLQKRKGQDMMIRALPAIRSAFPDILYALVGPGLERAHLEALAREHGVLDAVQFRGNPADDELVACYQQCDLFALPNRTIGWDVEGFGMVLVEAQACGRAVVAGNSGGTADTLDPGTTGERIDATSPQAVAAAVIALLSDRDRLSTMGVRARRWAVDRFDWSRLVADAQQLFASNGTVHGSVAAPACVEHG